MPEIYDHLGNPVKHGRARVNGIRMHYVIAGEGEPLLLLHGTPKTNYYWYKLFPLLTDKFTVVAPDLRGFGYTDKPTVAEGYDSRMNAKDVTELMTQLGFEKFCVHGEDRGAEFAYVVAAEYRDRVKALSYCEMLLCGGRLERQSFFEPDKVNSQFELKGPWVWHIPFFWVPDIPQMLIEGKEKAFWEKWIKDETYNPYAIAPEALDEWIACLMAAGGSRGCMETYRANFVNARINKELAQNKLTLPIMTIGAPEFFGDLPRVQMEEVSEGVEKSYVFEECGHSLALEAPDRLAEALKDFMLGR